MVRNYSSLRRYHTSPRRNRVPKVSSVAVLISMVALLASLLALPTAIANHGAAVPATAANPSLSGSCGVNIAIVIDTSGSITNSSFPPFLGSPGNPAIIKAAAGAFVDAFTGTPSEIGLFSFRSVAKQEQTATDVRDAAGANAVKASINAIDFGNLNNNGGTNWEAAFATAAAQGADVIAFITDGQPTVHGTNNDGVYQDDDLAAGVTQANAVKKAGTRVVAIGIGSGAGAIPVANLQAISGPVQGEDWYLASNFNALATTLADLAIELCGPSVSVVKMIDAGDGNGFVIAPGWQFAAAIDPAATTPVVANPVDGVTDAAGAVSFKWTSGGPSTVTITEVVQDYFAFQSATCDNQARAALTVTPTGDGFSVPVGQFEIVTCTVFNVATPPGIDLVKSASTTVAGVGDTVVYDYTATNTGGVVLDNLSLTDDVLGAITLGVTTLAPGASTTGAASHVVTAADLAGPLVNVATLTGTDPLGAVHTDQDTQSVGIAAIDIVKTVSDQNVTVGDEVTYTYTVTNIGSVVLTNVTVIDDQLGAITLGVTTLAPGEVTTGTATHVATSADRPNIVNVATVSGTDPNGGVHTDDDTQSVDIAAVPIPAAPAIDIVKVVNVQSVTIGDVVTYTYTVTNTGNVVLTDVVVVDDQLGAITLGATTLAPGEATTGTATYTIVEADVNRFPLVNIADVTAKAPNGDPVTDRDTAEISILVLQAVVTTTTIAPTTVAPTLPSTGPSPQTVPGGALGMSLLLGGSLLVMTAAQRRRRVVGVRVQQPADHEAIAWARTMLGLPKINPSSVDWARRMLGIKKRKIDLNIHR